MTDDTFVPTSIARRLIARMQATHDRRRIAVFAGPPGIGKTTAIDAFCARQPGEIVVVKISRRNAREVLALQHVLEGVRKLTSSVYAHAPSSIWDVRRDLFGAMCEWAGAEPRAARLGEYDRAAFGRLTVVFDEAQNLSREAIEALRYWNDDDRCYAPFSVGLIFVGNSEFSLAANGQGDSVISAAVADRALYLQTFDYDEVTDEDLAMVLGANGVADPAATAMILRSFSTRRSVRSLRRLLDFVGDLQVIARGGVITAATVREALEFV